MREVNAICTSHGETGCGYDDAQCPDQRPDQPPAHLLFGCGCGCGCGCVGSDMTGRHSGARRLELGHSRVLARCHAPKCTIPQSQPYRAEAATIILPVAFCAQIEPPQTEGVQFDPGVVQSWGRA